MTDPGKDLPPQTVSIPAGRFEQSPYFEYYANPDTLLGVAANRYYPDDIGEDTAAAYWALRREAVLFDVPEKPWLIEGPDAQPFLERIFAREIGSLAPGRGRYAVACTPDGGIFMDGILFRLAANRFFYVQADGALEEWLAAHKQGFDVKIIDPGSRVLQLQGPRSMQIMSALTNGDIDESMRYFDAGYFELGGQELFVSRTGWTGELGYEIYSDGARTDHGRLWKHLLDRGAPHGLVFASIKAMGIRRIEAGILDNISDFDMSMTPFEAGLGRFIDLDKTDFIGKSALLAAAREPLIYGIKCPSYKPYYGAEISDGEARVGRMTASAWSPYLDSGIGYVRFDRAGDWAGKRLSMQTREGDPAECEIVTLPFYDAEKRIPRGLAPADG